MIEHLLGMSSLRDSGDAYAEKVAREFIKMVMAAMRTQEHKNMIQVSMPCNAVSLGTVTVMISLMMVVCGRHVYVCVVEYFCEGKVKAHVLSLQSKARAEGYLAPARCAHHVAATPDSFKFYFWSCPFSVAEPARCAHHVAATPT